MRYLYNIKILIKLHIIVYLYSNSKLDLKMCLKKVRPHDHQEEPKTVMWLRLFLKNFS